MLAEPVLDAMEFTGAPAAVALRPGCGGRRPEVGDAFAADAAAAFHRTLAPALTNPGPLPAALALHHAVRTLRAADPQRP